ncbi:lipopolysaccharide export system ATP-binding protein [Desulfonatronum thiosulfatophilum]|uniref:Lipopolysaccharide export system ATP-binding protein n=1 Tax=Desulfonatronum thiosulfatophilum TaxID=617002 RepID=A0A1G6DYE8_9BACT|nr:LPS export ABC transporter ATP-binding protein [Desulfonatronum thiosulfatophilum]SDB50209.1 lipopolysaccharide export system ATP-binding protein [Desulfonatronum thiosulfatophilum]
MSSILIGSDLRKSFGQKEVVRGITVRVRQGEIVGLLGPNGAGKTTTFYMLVGVVKPSGGSVELDGQQITTWPLHERARLGLSYLPQESSVFKKLTVLQNLQIIFEYTDLSRSIQHKKAEALMEELGISKLADQKAMYLSGGERRRLEIARALIRNPKFMLLDEPFAGIDPLAVDDIQVIITSLRERGIGVLISDHNVRETLKICTRASIVFEGKAIFEGSPEEIVADSSARKVYLGEDFCL